MSILGSHNKILLKKFHYTKKSYEKVTNIVLFVTLAFFIWHFISGELSVNEIRHNLRHNEYTKLCYGVPKFWVLESYAYILSIIYPLSFRGNFDLTYVIESSSQQLLLVFTYLCGENF
jgi:hypothetical protein